MKKILLAGLIAGLLSAVPASAELFSVAAYAGAPFTDVEKNATVSGLSYIAKSPKFTLGGGVQVNLPLHLRIEVDALARPASFKVSNLLSNTDATLWRFPLMLQYRFSGSPLIQPFVGAGANFEHLYQIKNAVTSGSPGAFVSNTPGGLVIDGGIDLKLKLLRISGELRYTHQANSAIVSIEQINQAEVLVGIHF